MRVFILTLILSLFAIANASAIQIEQNGRMIEVPVCGGFAGIQCRGNEWCKFPPGATCGIGDQFGRCEPRPHFCPESFIPVCGCDGQTYGNACKAAQAGHDVAYPGHCRSKPK